ncbi:AAA ATPase, partial [Thiorhodococcus drewsii AZ1]
MSATVHIQDDSIALLADCIPIGSRRPLSKDACVQLAGFARRYTLLEHHRDPRAALALGQELYRWLDGEQQGLSRLLEGNVGTLLLTLHCPSRHPTAAEWAALQAPWELLANAEGHLAADPLLQFALVRRLGPIQTAPAPDDYRLALAFMAAAPDGVSELDYEAEEAAILSAVGNTQLDLLVEESGEAQTLGRRLAEAGGLPVLHLSCHGHAAWRVQQDATPQPILLLEDDAGAAHPTLAPELLRALRPALPRLLFLSACSSAAAPSQAAATGGLPPAADHKAADGGSGSSAPPSPAHSLTSALIEAGLPAIIGWDGPVADSAATQFAAELYARLACGEGLALAVAEARRRLLESESDSLRRDWHLARLWLGPEGDEAAPLVAGTRARSLLPADYVPGELLGKKDLLGNAVPVASHALFVGRRRELQRALRDLKGQHHAGVLITGMGRLGKSSLAARLANRCRDDLALAVLHGRFGLEDLLERLDDTLAPYPAARELIRQGQTQVRAARARGEDAALQALGDLLTDLLSGPCRQRDASGPALLLVLDDFEQLLDEHAGVRTVQSRSVGLITTLMRAFDPLRTTSRLLVTSRFPFRLGPPGADPAERLARLELASFNDTAERKLTLRQQTLARLQTLPDLEAREALIPRARAAARGNPGLLDLLSARLLLNPKVPLAKATAALEQMESYLAGGDLPTSEVLRAQLEAIAVQSLLDLAGSDGRALLRALTLFALPVPSAIATGLATELGGDLEVLRDLALLEPGADPVLPGETGVRLSPLAAARLEPLTDTEA